METLPSLPMGKLKPEMLSDLPGDIISGRARENTAALLSLNS